MLQILCAILCFLRTFNICCLAPGDLPATHRSITTRPFDLFFVLFSFVLFCFVSFAVVIFVLVVLPMLVYYKFPRASKTAVTLLVPEICIFFLFHSTKLNWYERLRKTAFLYSPLES